MFRSSFSEQCYWSTLDDDCQSTLKVWTRESAVSSCSAEISACGDDLPGLMINLAQLINKVALDGDNVHLGIRHILIDTFVNELLDGPNPFYQKATPAAEAAGDADREDLLD